MESKLESALEKALPDEKIYAAARYALISKGKRVRPRMLLSLSEELNGDQTMALAAAIAIEMVHTYSLVHDDLPCMDDDDFRRGRPSLHRAFDEATAVLAGDLLLTHAFLHISPYPKLVKSLAMAAGGEGMIAGQLLDLGKSGDRKELHRLKTGALFACTVEMAALSAAIDPEPYMRFGELYGLLFQAIDDLEDHDPLADELEAKKLYQKTLDHLPCESLREFVTALNPITKVKIAK